MSNAKPERASGNISIAKVALLTSAFSSGAAIMIYEFVAIRFLQRDFGGTVDVWASEIAVCLAGLAAGYSVGGWMADKFQSLRLVSAALFVGGASGLLIEVLARYAGNLLLDIQYGLMWHPLLAAGISTFFPILALGTVLPQAIRLQTKDLNRVGATVGWIATVSTVGSIAGVLVTAMLLLPNWGGLRILYTSSAVLMALGVIVAFASRRGAVLALALFLFLPFNASAQVRFETYSAYHHILVQDAGNVRAFLFDNNQQSLMSLSDPNAGGFEYTEYFHLPMVFDPTIKHVLFIGLGGATGPKSFLQTYPEVRIDVAEIDPAVVRVSKEYFYIPSDTRLKIQVSDGRAYLRRNRTRYGAVMMDAYGSGRYGAYLPYHMATKEFFEIIWQRLVNGGCLFYNAVGAYGGMNNDVIVNLQTTLESVFQMVYVFQARTSVNTVFIAMKIDAANLDANGTRDGKGWPDGPWLQHPLAPAGMRALIEKMPATFLTLHPSLTKLVGQFSPVYGAPRRGIILTDDYAPVDVGRGRR